jgi:xanthine permease XanP
VFGSPVTTSGIAAIVMTLVLPENQTDAAEKTASSVAAVSES